MALARSSAGKVLLVVGNDDALVGRGDRCDDRVECASGLALRIAGHHKPGPFERGFLVERKYPPGEKGPRALRTGKPGFQAVAALAGPLFKDAATNLRDRQRGNEEILVYLFGHPRHQACRWLRLQEVADDVRVEQVAH